MSKINSEGIKAISEIKVSLLCPTFYELWIPFFVHQLWKMTKNLIEPFEIIIATHINKKKYLKKAQKYPTLLDKIKFIKTHKDTSIGTKRNMLDKAAQGLFLVSVDDDDWYPDYRIGWSIEQLIKHEKDLLTTSDFLCYNLIEEKYFRYHSYSESCLCRIKKDLNGEKESKKFNEVNQQEGQGLIDDNGSQFLNAKNIVLCLAFTHVNGKRSSENELSCNTEVNGFIEEYFDKFEKQFITQVRSKVIIRNSVIPYKVERIFHYKN